MYPTNRQIAEMPNASRQALTTRYGESLSVLRAHKRMTRIKAAAVDMAEHCCDECDDLEERYGW